MIASVLTRVLDYSNMKAVVYSIARVHRIKMRQRCICHNIVKSGLLMAIKYQSALDRWLIGAIALSNILIAHHVGSTTLLNVLYVIKLDNTNFMYA